MEYTHRYIARIVLEAETALFVGSGETSLLKDALVQKDHHGFPMIQGTSLAGVLRHALEDNVQNEEDEKSWNSFFGYQQKDKGLGSQVKISAAYLLLNDHKIAEGLTNDSPELLKHFDELPSRQHVRITDRGVADAKDGGLFENEVVYKGCRFIFEIEVKGNGEEENQWQALLKQLKSPLFRLGQGTRNGYGKLKVISCKTKIFKLKEPTDFDLYLDFDPSLNAKNPCLTEEEVKFENKLTHYKLDLNSDTFFIFSSGFEDEEVNNKPLTEKVVHYENNEMNFKTQTVIPASSIKGAISHRTCFHYNKLKEIYADKIELEDFNQYLGIKNDAVYALFGAEAGSKDKTAQRGKVLFNDQYFDDVNNDKIFNHVAIDRFTGGAMDGALFSEKVSRKDGGLMIDIYLETDDDNPFTKALEEALTDICKGLLPLGGMSTKGHGIFTGKLLKNNEEIYNYA